MSSFMLPNSTLLYLKLFVILKHNSRARKRAEGKSLRVQPWTWVRGIHICVIIICDWCRLCSQHKRRWEKRKLPCFRNVAERVEKECSNWILSPDRFPIFQFPAGHVSNFAISSVIPVSLGSRGLMQFLGGNWKVQVQGVHLHSGFLHIYSSATTTSTYSMIPVCAMQHIASLSLAFSERNFSTQDHTTIIVYYCSALSSSHTSINKMLFSTVQLNGYCWQSCCFFFHGGAKSRLECTNTSVMTFIGKQTLVWDLQAFFLFTSSFSVIYWLNIS